jgi:hypothetical protein
MDISHDLDAATSELPQSEPLDTYQDIYTVSALAFLKMASRKDYEVFVIRPKDFASLAAISSQDYESFMAKMHKEPPSREELQRQVRLEYYNYLSR